MGVGVHVCEHTENILKGCHYYGMPIFMTTDIYRHRILFYLLEEWIFKKFLFLKQESLKLYFNILNRHLV